MSAARYALALALADAHTAGLIVPCDGSDLWISEKARERAQAATQCDGCPVLDECRAAGREERWGVWAGVDRYRNTQPKEKP